RDHRGSPRLKLVSPLASPRKQPAGTYFEDERPATCNKSPECWDARFARVTTPTAESVSDLRLDAPQVRVLPRQRVASTIQICLDILNEIDVIRFQHVEGRTDRSSSSTGVSWPMTFLPGSAS